MSQIYIYHLKENKQNIKRTYLAKSRFISFERAFTNPNKQPKSKFNCEQKEFPDDFTGNNPKLLLPDVKEVKLFEHTKSKTLKSLTAL